MAHDFFSCHLYIIYSYNIPMNFLFIATDMAVKFYTQSAKMTRCRQQSTTSWVIVEETYLDLSIKISNCIPVDITLDAGGSYKILDHIANSIGADRAAYRSIITYHKRCAK